MAFAIPIDIFLQPIRVAAISGDELYRPTQVGNTISVYDEIFPDITECDLVIVGCGEQRGDRISTAPDHAAPDAIRRQLYALQSWHPDIRIADIGNIVTGASVNDSYAALRSV